MAAVSAHKHSVVPRHLVSWSPVASVCFNVTRMEKSLCLSTSVVGMDSGRIEAYSDNQHE